jgi:thiamine-monophosphate kinase
LALTLPTVNENWLTAFAQGLQACSAACPMSLIGGDTTKGPLTITITAQGWVPNGKALKRSGAKPDDDIYVSGWIGEAGLGLHLALNPKPSLNLAEKRALERLNRPVPRVVLGKILREMAHSAIDVSDGLLADLNHLLKASKCGADLQLEDYPCTAEVIAWSVHDRLKPFKAGDDYEICFTAPPGYAEEIRSISAQLDLPIFRIGKITEQLGLRLNGLACDDLCQLGYNHFYAR